MKSVFIFVFILIIIISLTASASQDILRLDNVSNLYVIWSEFDGNDCEIYISQRNAGGWTEKGQITNNDTEDFSPCIAVDKDANPWIVWVGDDGISTAVFSRYWKGKSWSKISQVESVDLYEDTVPAITIDENNIPWVVWCGSDGKDDDIYISFWNGLNWEAEEMINIDDDGPDLTPAITSIPGRKELFIAWMGYNGWNYELYYTFYARGEIGEERTFSFEKIRSFGECPSFIKYDPAEIQIFWLEKGSYYSTLGDGINWQDKKEVDLAYTDRFLLDLLARFNTPIWIAWEIGGRRQNFRLMPVMAKKVLTKKKGLEMMVWQYIINFFDSKVYADNGITKYIAFGNSITEGGELGGYPPKLENKLNAGIGPSTVVNCGVRGERTNEGLDRINSVLDQYNAQYLLLMEGTNDITFHYSMDEIRFNLGEMIDRTLTHGVVPLLALLPPRKDSLDPRTGYINEEVIAPLAEEKSVTLVDQYTQMAGNKDAYLADDKHPNQAGYELMSQIWFNAIKDMLNPKEQNGDDSGGCGSVILPANRDGGRGINFGVLFIVFILALWFRLRLCRG